MCSYAPKWVDKKTYLLLRETHCSGESNPIFPPLCYTQLQNAYSVLASDGSF